MRKKGVSREKIHRCTQRTFYMGFIILTFEDLLLRIIIYLTDTKSVSSVPNISIKFQISIANWLLDS